MSIAVQMYAGTVLSVVVNDVYAGQGVAVTQVCYSNPVLHSCTLTAETSLYYY